MAGFVDLLVPAVDSFFHVPVFPSAEEFDEQRKYRAWLREKIERNRTVLKKIPQKTAGVFMLADYAGPERKRGVLFELREYVPSVELVLAPLLGYSYRKKSGHPVRVYYLPMRRRIALFLTALEFVHRQGSYRENLLRLALYRRQVTCEHGLQVIDVPLLSLILRYGEDLEMILIRMPRHSWIYHRLCREIGLRGSYQI